MLTPATTPDLIERIRKSGLVPPAELQGFLAGPRAVTHEPNVARLLERLVEAHLLTRFQADRLGAGKYKGFVLGSYTILDRLGAGGMGQVFLAEHAAMRRFVALKVLPGNVYEDDIARERFFREARAAATLDHPNIVRVFDMNREGKLLYLVMEYVEGASLQTVIERDGKRSVAAAASYAQQMAHGLQHAHERGLVHRDIKPGNTLVDRAGVARLLDLGLVRSESDGDSKLTSPLAGGRTILGTVDYLAPEQALDSSSVDIRADIYSLGATLYFLLAGHPVFPEGRAGQKLMWQQWRDPTPIDRLRPEVPEALAAIVHRALAKKREDRFQTPRDLAEALTPWVAGLVPPSSGLILAPPYRPFLGRGATASGNDRTSKRSLSAGISRTAPDKPAVAMAIAAPTSGMVRLDKPFELDQETPNALRSTDSTTVDERPHKRVAADSGIVHPPATSRRALILVSAVTAMVVGLLFLALSAILFAFGVIRT